MYSLLMSLQILLWFSSLEDYIKPCYTFVAEEEERRRRKGDAEEDDTDDTKDTEKEDT
jgi:hypothetical protein